MTAPPTIQRTLTDVLADLLRRARAQPGTPQRATLAGGLGIAIQVTAGQVHLQLTRTGNAPPSAKEIETIVNHWPETGLLTRTEPVRFTRHYLQTIIGPAD